ncbi:MAG: arsenite methyltransferase [Ignavibacteriaceae bacterium]
MTNENELKNIVREKYGQIAVQSNEKTKSSGCGCGCSSDNLEYSNFSDDYKKLDGYVEEADLGLGCGLPTEHADIKNGDIIVDLGSGAGNDAFIARQLVGDEGKVIGIDFTEQMINKANVNKTKLGYKNVEFKLSELEDTGLDENSVDVVISNCVLNLVPNKQKAFEEIYRILKPGAHFSVSDIVVKGEIPEEFKKSAELYAGCVSGAIEQEEYIQIIKDAGFKNIEIKKSKSINLPDEIINKYLNDDQSKQFKKSEFGIFSITANGVKPKAF